MIINQCFFIRNRLLLSIFIILMYKHNVITV